MFVFFFNDTATTEIYTLSLHDALPISFVAGAGGEPLHGAVVETEVQHRLHHSGHRDAGPGAHGQEERTLGIAQGQDRKSTRLNSSHSQISYAVFCLKKKKEYHCKRLTH